MSQREGGGAERLLRSSVKELSLGIFNKNSKRPVKGGKGEKPPYLPSALSFFLAPVTFRPKDASVEQERNAYMRDIVWPVVVRPVPLSF